jgi:hypothetical protein
MVRREGLGAKFAKRNGLRKAKVYRGGNSGPGKDIVGKLDTQTRN